jgi:hypothetical protein
MDCKLDAMFERMSRSAVARPIQPRGGLEMKFIRIAMASPALLHFLPIPRVTPAEAEKIKAALEAWGCTGGKMEKDTEGSGYFEVDDAKCRDGQYDIKLDKDFKVKTRD